MVYLRIHEAKEGRVVAVCDKSLIGKVFREGSKVLDLKKHQDFYKGNQASNEEVLAALKNFDSVNLVGEKATQAAIEARLAVEKDLLHISGIPYLHIYHI